MGNWWDDRKNLRDMVEFLFRIESDQVDILYAMDKPWKWSAEYASGWTTVTTR